MKRIMLAALLGAALLTIGPPTAHAAARCFGKVADIVGTAESDRLLGTSDDDVIYAGRGHDRVSGRGGNDLICGGEGRDTIRGNSGADRISAGDGFDFVLGHDGDDVLRGGAGADVLMAGNGDDRMLGGSDRQTGDFLLGEGGNDEYAGGSGDFDIASFALAPAGVSVDLGVSTPQVTGDGLDTLSGIEGAVGSAHNDILRGQDVPSEFGNGLFGGDGVDLITGLAGNDFIVGGLGNDEGGTGLDGGAGNDLIFGDEADFFFESSGDDDLYGGEGDDILDGGGNVTGPPAGGDYGDGGPQMSEDLCSGLEQATDCERFSRVAARGSAAIPDRALRLRSAWLGAVRS